MASRFPSLQQRKNTMGYYKNLLIEVAEAIEEATGVDFDIVNDYIIDGKLQQEGQWYIGNIGGQWFAFSDEQINPVKIVFNESRERVMIIVRSEQN